MRYSATSCRLAFTDQQLLDCNLNIYILNFLFCSMHENEEFMEMQTLGSIFYVYPDRSCRTFIVVKNYSQSLGLDRMSNVAKYPICMLELSECQTSTPPLLQGSTSSTPCPCTTPSLWRSAGPPGAGRGESSTLAGLPSSPGLACLCTESPTEVLLKIWSYHCNPL